MPKKKRPPIRRPVLQFRITQAEYEEIVAASIKHDLTISQEAARRLRAYTEREHA